MTAAQPAPSAALTAALAEIDNSLSSALDRLLALLAIPSISTDPEYKPACRKAADWLVADLQSLGFTAETRDTPGHPMVVARHKPQDGIAARISCSTAITMCSPWTRLSYGQTIPSPPRLRTRQRAR